MAKFAIQVDKCRGATCALCWTQAPQFFALAENGKATVHHQPHAADEAAVRAMAGQCPVGAIVEYDDTVTTTGQVGPDDPTTNPPPE